MHHTEHTRWPVTKHVQVKVWSNSDCLSDPVSTDFWHRDFWIRVGLTSAVGYAPFQDQDEVVLQPTGRGYVANKNKMIGTVRKCVRVVSDW